MLDGNNPAVVTAMAGAALRLVECGLVVPSERAEAIQRLAEGYAGRLGAILRRVPDDDLSGEPQPFRAKRGRRRRLKR